MKRKNLFLSLISSILVAVAIVTVTICSVVQPKSNNSGKLPDAGNININRPEDETVDQATLYDLENTFNRNGSAEYPYIIYSAENFIAMISEHGGSRRVVTKPVTENVMGEDGQVITVEKRDGEGHIIFEPVLDANGNKTYDVNHFVLVNDVNFSGVDYVTLFNNGTSFIGNLDGKGYSIKNITINVDENNYSTNFTFQRLGNKYARVALFGETNGAVIKNIKIDALNVNVANSVYDSIRASEYGVYVELMVAGVAGYAKDTTLSNVTMNASVNGSNYSVDDVDSDGNYISENAMGGVVAVAENLTLDKTNISVDVTVNAGASYYVGGIAAYGRTAKVSESNIDVEIITTASRKLSMAGMFAYGRKLDIQDTNVNFTLTETEDANSRQTYVSSLVNGGTAKAADMSTAAGLVAIIRANDDTQKTLISNVKVTSNVDFDCIYAGAILDAYSTSDKTNEDNKKLITLSDIIVDVNANALAIHAFARQLVATTITYSDAAKVDGYYNIKIAGNAKLTKYEAKINTTTTVTREAVTILTAVEKSFMDYYYTDLYIQVSSSINSALMNGFDRWSIAGKSFGSYKVV